MVSETCYAYGLKLGYDDFHKLIIKFKAHDFFVTTCMKVSYQVL